MIDFEFSNVIPVVSTSMDDDDYVEYPLDNLAGFPSNVEEEERMFMEVVIESLKDLELRHPSVEDTQNSYGVAPQEPALSSRVDPAATSAANGSDKASVGPTGNGPPSTGASTRADVSAVAQSSSDSDIDDQTKATVTVVRNPTNNIMDGLLRRWDLNFFKNR